MSQIYVLESGGVVDDLNEVLLAMALEVLFLQDMGLLLTTGKLTMATSFCWTWAVNITAVSVSLRIKQALWHS